jgi:hypothetical protein
MGGAKEGIISLDSALDPNVTPLLFLSEDSDFQID